MYSCVQSHDMYVMITCKQNPLRFTIQPTHTLTLQVNGFEVYDPEEAILLFLEQDQDISLTVARKIKVREREGGGEGRISVCGRECA